MVTQQSAGQTWSQVSKTSMLCSYQSPFPLHTLNLLEAQQASQHPFPLNGKVEQGVGPAL